MIKYPENHICYLSTKTYIVDTHYFCYLSTKTFIVGTHYFAIFPQKTYVSGIGPAMQKGVYGADVNSKGPNQPAHLPCLFSSFGASLSIL